MVYEIGKTTNHRQNPITGCSEKILKKQLSYYYYYIYYLLLIKSKNFDFYANNI